MDTAVASTPRGAARSPERGAPPPDVAARTTIGDWVRHWAAEQPDAPAVIDTDHGADLTWRELDEQADRLALMLLRLGVAPGEPVACQLPNVPEFAVLTVATTRIGALVCPLMPIFRTREVGFMLRRSRSRVLLVPDRFRGRDYPSEIAELATVDGELPVRHVIVVGYDGPAAADAMPAAAESGAESVRGPIRWHAYDAASAETPADAEGPASAEGLASAETRDNAAAIDTLADRAPAPTALAQMLFTSGTSGEPKGALQRMDALTRAAAMQARHLGLTGEDRIFIPSPLAHQTGFLYGMWVAFLLGAPQILQSIWNGPSALEMLRRHHGTFVQAATPFLADLTAAVEETGNKPDDLRIFVATGAAVPRELAQRATRLLGTAVCGAWGTTEGCLGSLAAPGDEPAKMWGTDGRALDGVTLRIVDDDGTALAPGQEGNLEVKSDCLFEGYVDRPDLTAEAVTNDGYYRSGDLAVIDEDGFMRISGRVKDVINRGGEKIPAAEIEQLLYGHPAVAEVAIVAMPDDRLGERACAFVVSAAGYDALDIPEMQRFLDRAGAAKQYWPERIELVDELPCNPSGKIQKFILRQQIQEILATERTQP